MNEPIDSNSTNSSPSAAAAAGDQPTFDPNTTALQLIREQRWDDLIHSFRFLSAQPKAEGADADADTPLTTKGQICSFLTSHNVQFVLLFNAVATSRSDSEASKDGLLKIIEFGGVDLIKAKYQSHPNGNGTCTGTVTRANSNLLHLVCESIGEDGMESERSFLNDLISKIIEIGGRDIVMDENSKGWNALHCATKSAPNDVISKLIAVGGRDMVWGEG